MSDLSDEIEGIEIKDESCLIVDTNIDDNVRDSREM